MTSVCLAVMAYMQFVEDYSEPQPSMFYQTPQNEHIYQKKNKYLREVYGINDSFISLDPPQDLAPPPALPPKQRQLVSDSSGTPGRATCSASDRGGGTTSCSLAACEHGFRHFASWMFLVLCNLVFRPFPVSFESPKML